MPMTCKPVGQDFEINPDPKNPTGRRKYFVSGISESETPNDVMVKILQTAPLYLLVYVPMLTSDVNSIVSGRIYRLGVTDLDMLGAGFAEGTMNWGVVDAVPHVAVGGENPSKNQADGGPAGDELVGPEIQFSTKGGTQHITNLDERMIRRHRKAVGQGEGSAPNMGGAIGVSRDRVEGCDVYTGKLEWSITLKGVPVSQDYIAFLASCTGCTNIEPMFNREAESLLFLGADGGYKPGDGGTVTYSFLEGRNREDVEISGTTFAAIKAHDYVWCEYKDDVVDGIKVQTPKHIYVDRVYEPKHLELMFEDYP